MLAEVEAWGLKPSVVTGDSWYASKDNLNILKDKALSGLFALEANRLVSPTTGVCQNKKFRYSSRWLNGKSQKSGAG
ncbi:IS4 transposase [Nostoc flagelliforme CCNUN1]|uniref:IS4 transposase n=1 Tax=Nostoc flagelliforme CCNUN1 TaxID=2038116 RepID=A0A2K8T3V3_9NOSO|nr:IS4 transposase [Nostoc flagelliforme CCNUN1]